jgi:hypothetical protein
MNPYIDLMRDSFKHRQVIDELVIDNKFLNFGTPDKQSHSDNIADFKHAMKDGKLLKRINHGDYTINLYKVDDKHYDAFALFDKQLIGSLLSADRGYVKNFPQVYYTYVLEKTLSNDGSEIKHQGKGLGYLMHKLLLDAVGGIVSDATLTDASLATIKKLGKANHMSVFTSERKLVPYDEALLAADKDAVIVVSKVTLI